jgi:hypothetical protein
MSFNDAAKVREAFLALDPSKDEDWNEDGSPSLISLRTLSGEAKLNKGDYAKFEFPVRVKPEASAQAGAKEPEGEPDLGGAPQADDKPEVIEGSEEAASEPVQVEAKPDTVEAVGAAAVAELTQLPGDDGDVDGVALTEAIKEVISADDAKVKGEQDALEMEIVRQERIATEAQAALKKLHKRRDQVVLARTSNRNDEHAHTVQAYLASQHAQTAERVARLTQVRALVGPGHVVAVGTQLDSVMARNRGHGLKRPQFQKKA